MDGHLILNDLVNNRIHTAKKTKIRNSQGCVIGTRTTLLFAESLNTGSFIAIKLLREGYGHDCQENEFTLVGLNEAGHNYNCKILLSERLSKIYVTYQVIEIFDQDPLFNEWDVEYESHQATILYLEKCFSLEAAVNEL